MRGISEATQGNTQILLLVSLLTGKVDGSGTFNGERISSAALGLKEAFWGWK